MGVLRTAQLILMEYVKEGLEEEGKWHQGFEK